MNDRASFIDRAKQGQSLWPCTYSFDHCRRCDRQLRSSEIWTCVLCRRDNEQLNVEKLLVLRRAKNELLRRDDEHPEAAAREHRRLAKRDADTYHTALLPPYDGVSISYI
jgi:hypothetical protein